jgi:hypothetical protein
MCHFFIIQIIYLSVTVFTFSTNDDYINYVDVK